MKWLYQVFGISKQAYYQRINAQKERQERNEVILQLVAQERLLMPRIGTIKLLHSIRPKLNEMGIQIGRDMLFKLLRDNGLLVKKTKAFHVTTDSNHDFNVSPNLIKNIKITHAEQVFVADITYLKTDQKHAYLALVTDGYSKKIMGWCVDNNMKVSLVKRALTMALNNKVHNNEWTFHHSDRGKQYCCPDFCEFIKGKGILLSTTEQYDPYENAVAERVNGILKYEFGLRKTLPSLEVAQKMIQQAVDIYNNKRLHWSLGLKTPQEIHNQYNSIDYKSYAIT